MGITGNLVTHNIPTAISAGDFLVPVTTLPPLYITLASNTNQITFATAGNAQTIAVNSVALGNVVPRAFIDFQNVGGVSPGGGVPAVPTGTTRIRVTNVNSDRNFQALAPIGSPAIPQLAVGQVVNPQPAFTFVPRETAAANTLTAAVNAAPAPSATTFEITLTAGSIHPGDIITVNAIGPRTVASVVPGLVNNSVLVTLATPLPDAPAAGDAVVIAPLVVGGPPAGGVVAFTNTTDHQYFLAGDPITFANGSVSSVLAVQGAGFAFNPAVAPALPTNGGMYFNTSAGPTPLQLTK
jgi:hypothetical protein